MYELSQHAGLKNAVYLAVTLPLLWTLGRALGRRDHLIRMMQPSAA